MSLSAAQISQMQTVQADLMADTCVIQSRSATADSYGEMIASYTDGDAIACGFSYAGDRHKFRAPDMTLQTTDAELRIPLTETIGERDRVKLTKRMGTTLGTALVFEVNGPIRRGPSAYLVPLRKVTP